MANVIQSSDLGQDEDQNQNQPGQAGQNNVNQAGQAPVQNNSQAPTITSNQVSSSNPNQQKGSGFTNVQSVLKANQGNQLGNTVGNNIQQVGSSAQDNLRNAQNQFNQQSQQNQFDTGANQQLVQNVLANPTQYTTTDQNNPNSQQGKLFNTLISGQYQGPTNLNNAQQLQSQAGNLAQMGSALSSSGGRQALLQQMFGNPQYTSGQQTLDNLLLSQSNSPALQNAKRQALTAQGQVNNAVTGAQAEGQQLTNQAQNFGQNVQNQLGTTVTANDHTLQNAATAAQTGRDTQYQKALTDLQTGNVTQDEANLLGLSQGENVYNLLSDPSKFLTENPVKASAQNVANADDYSKMQALQSLAGQFSPQTAQGIFQNYQDPTQAGQFTANPDVAGDTNAFSDALNKTQQNYNSIYQPAQTAQQNATDENRLATGQISDAEKSQILSNPALSTQLQNQLSAVGWNNPTIQKQSPQLYNQVLGNILLSQKYPGAAQGTLTQNQQWANSNLQASNAAYQNALAQLQQQYGTPEMINIGGPQNTPQNQNIVRRVQT